jgi:ubiquinone/menaquinone biosynthesis C-methylase UbiE
VQYLRQEGIEAYGVDIAENHALWKDKGVEKYCQSYDGYTIPFEDNYFDMVGCFETFEHIVPEDCERILKEILRVGRNLFVMTIALNVEMCPVGGTFHTHCNIQKPQWWKDLFKKVGFNLIAAECLQYQEMKGEPLMTLFVYASKGETDLYIHTTTEPSNPERRERIRNECGVSRRIVQV